MIDPSSTSMSFVSTQSSKLDPEIKSPAHGAAPRVPIQDAWEPSQVRSQHRRASHQQHPSLGEDGLSGHDGDQPCHPTPGASSTTTWPTEPMKSLTLDHEVPLRADQEAH